MKKTLFTLFALAMTLALTLPLALGASAADGDILYFEDYETITSSELPYNPNLKSGGAATDENTAIAMTVENGVLSIKNSGETTYFIEILSKEAMAGVTSFTVSLDIKAKYVSSTGNCNAGIAFAWDGSSNAYTSIQFKKEGTCTQLISSVADKSLTQSLKYFKNFFAEGQYGADVWLKVKITVDGSNVKLYVNDTLITEAPDALTHASPLFFMIHDKDGTDAATEFLVDNLMVYTGTGEPNMATKPSTPDVEDPDTPDVEEPGNNEGEGGGEGETPAPAPDTDDGITAVMLLGLGAAAVVMSSRKRR